MIDDRNEYEKTRAWLRANHVSSDNRVFNDHRHAITASSHPFSTEGLLALRFFSAADTWLEKPIVIRTANSKWRMGFVIFLVSFTNLRLNLRKSCVR